MTLKYIKHTAVIGAGTMGRQIAASIANAGTHVLLLDIVPEGANDRDILAKKAIRQLTEDKLLFSPARVGNIQPGNIEDNLMQLKDVDWVIECVPEDEHIKHQTYQTLQEHTHNDTLISSNTSTIPLHRLKQGLSDAFQQRLCITHFFNPPNRMPLVELVAGRANDNAMIRCWKQFADTVLGKNVIEANDMAGFIANRIGIFFLLAGIEETYNAHLSIEAADAVMNGAFGLPKTGIFGLADLIGLSLIPDIANSMKELLPPQDAFHALEHGLSLIKTLQNQQAAIDGKPGFYASNKEGMLLAFDLESGHYRPKERVDITIGALHRFLGQDVAESHFARRLLARVLAYTASIAPDIAGNIGDIDAAMEDGYGWKRGPFALMDRLGVAWFSAEMEKEGIHPPVLLKQAMARGFYAQDEQGECYLGFDGRYMPEKSSSEKWSLRVKTAGKVPILTNASAQLWDVGDGIGCIAFTRNMGVIDEQVLDMLLAAVERAEDSLNGLIIGHDGEHFSAGLDLHIVLESAKTNRWQRVEDIIRQGQNTMMRIKTARIPVVPALCGYVVGGACELTLHCSAAEAYSFTRMGLVEADIGVIPAWGGTKEHCVRALVHGGRDVEIMVEEMLKAFRTLAFARKSANVDEAFALGFLQQPSAITANRKRLLSNAKQHCLALADNFHPNKEQIIAAPVETLYVHLMREVNRLYNNEPDMELHRLKLLETLASVLSGHRALALLERQAITPARAEWDRLDERLLLDSSLEAFMELVQTPESIQKIRKVLKQ